MSTQILNEAFFAHSMEGEIDSINYSYCELCNLNCIIETKGSLYCISCEKDLGPVDTCRKNTNYYIGNKIIHYKNVIKRLLTKSDNAALIQEIRTEAAGLNMELEDIDSNYISKKLKHKKIYISKDYKKVFEILCELNEEYIFDIGQDNLCTIGHVFKTLALFIQKEEYGRSINYNFFLDKIFNSVNNLTHLCPQNAKNNKKNNENQMTWLRFVEYFNLLAETEKNIGIPVILSSVYPNDTQFEYSLLV